MGSVLFAIFCGLVGAGLCYAGIVLWIMTHWRR